MYALIGSYCRYFSLLCVKAPSEVFRFSYVIFALWLNGFRLNIFISWWFSLTFREHSEFY